MKIRMLESPMKADVQEGAPEGFVLWLGLDRTATEETGTLHLCEIPIPDGFSPLLENMVTQSTVIEVTVKAEYIFEEKMMGLEVYFVSIIPFMVGIRND